MPLHGAGGPDRTPGRHRPRAMRSVADPVLGEELELPTRRLASRPVPATTAYQLVHDELMLDGNARLNLATFVTTWMEEPAARLMAECAEKNMIDKDEYPQTAELERRCVSILANLWHAPDAGDVIGCSTTGSSEACMLGGLALKRRWSLARRAAGRSIDRPNLVMGANVQVCWDKFCNYWEVEPRIVPMEGERFHLSAEEAVARCDENTIGVVAVLGSTFDGSYEPVAEIAAGLDALQARTGADVPLPVHGASGRVIAPFPHEDPARDLPPDRGAPAARGRGAPAAGGRVLLLCACAPVVPGVRAPPLGCGPKLRSLRRPACTNPSSLRGRRGGGHPGPSLRSLRFRSSVCRACAASPSQNALRQAGTFRHPP